MNIEQVRALAAIVDEGTVEGGAFVLGITASAASQRIRALESKLGQVLFRRTNPVTVTEAGEAVLKYAREVELLESETLGRLHDLSVDGAGVGSDAGGGRDGAGNRRKRERTVLRIAVNADSMSTWFRPVFAEVADWGDVSLRIEMVDQDKALGLLTAGEVLGAITSEKRGGYGTQVQHLGEMRYVAVATRDFLEREGARIRTHRGARGEAKRCREFAEVDLATLPMVNFGRDDDLQFEFLRRHGVSALPPMSLVPSSTEFAVAVASGLGWGMIPVAQLDGFATDPVLHGADLVPIGTDPGAEVPLHWHHWTLASAKLERLTAALHRAAAHMR